MSAQLFYSFAFSISRDFVVSDSGAACLDGMPGVFGWKITAAYVIAGILIGVFSGLILDRMKLEKHLVQEFSFGWNESTSIVRKLWIWVLIGVGVGAAIHNYVPDEVIQGIINRAGVFIWKLRSHRPDSSGFISKRSSPGHSLGLYDGDSSPEHARSNNAEKSDEVKIDSDLLYSDIHCDYIYRIFVQSVTEIMARNNKNSWSREDGLSLNSLNL